MRLPATLKWIALALLGLAIAAGVALAATALTSQQIGISSESVSSGNTLAPHFHEPQGKPRAEHEDGGRPADTTGEETAEPTTSPAEPEPPLETTPTEPKGEDGGSGKSGSDDRGGDD